MGQLIEGRFGKPGEAARPGPERPASSFEDAVDAFVTFRLLRSEIKSVPADEYEGAAAELMELAAEQRALLDGLTPEDRGRAINLGLQQINAEGLGFLEPPQETPPDISQARTV